MADLADRCTGESRSSHRWSLGRTAELSGTAKTPAVPVSLNGFQRFSAPGSRRSCLPDVTLRIMTWEETHMIRTICLLVAAMSWWAAEAAGQSAIHAPARSFEELRATVASGDRVIVVDRSGEETRGLVASI